uniref:Uncharacterized protein n=1 Tax=Sphaerodactylus townsendi TaxID=933632 RepID=A0ACB8EEU6_9SAUR
MLCPRARGLPHEPDALPTSPDPRFLATTCRMSETEAVPLRWGLATSPAPVAPLRIKLASLERSGVSLLVAPQSGRRVENKICNAIVLLCSSVVHLCLGAALSTSPHLEKDLVESF